MTFADIRSKADSVWREFAESPRPRVLVGAGTCGKAAGASEVIDAIKEHFDGRGSQADIFEVGCLGLCYAEPMIEVSAPGTARILYGNVTPENVCDILDAHLKDGATSANALAVMDADAADGVPAFSELPMMTGQVRIVTRNCGLVDPENIFHYIARGGYSGLAKALEMTPEDVIDLVKKSGLRGRGGAGFPTGVKWEFCRRAPGDRKYMICNADEGDPGAFMDRAVLESDPHSVLEGMAIAARAIGASHGYIYARAEYPLAIERLEKAIVQAGELSLLGDDILGGGFSFHLKLKKGAGAFVCGEETSLLASIEGKRGMPRSRPPFPAQKGLYGQPTNINNVETLANVGAIVANGAEWFAQYGTENSRGTKTFALAGRIERTGLVEVPLGTTLSEIVYEIGGGIPEGKAFKAVQTGGPSGGCLPASMLESMVDYETLARAGAIMGSGGMVVMDENTCMVEIARYFINFTQAESCGKCVPCRLGTKQMLNILERIISGRGAPEDMAALEDIAAAVKVGSLCGLGQTAPNPVLTTLRYFGEEYEAHIFEKRCPAGACRELLSYSIDKAACICCSKCARECPAGCITGKAGKAPSKVTEKDKAAGKVGVPFEIDNAKCVKCGACIDVCPVGAVSMG